MASEKWATEDAKVAECLAELVFIRRLSYYRAMQLATELGVKRTPQATRKKIYSIVKRMKKNLFIPETPV